MIPGEVVAVIYRCYKSAPVHSKAPSKSNYISGLLINVMATPNSIIVIA